jgi:hypothetical protein
MSIMNHSSGKTSVDPEAAKAAANRGARPGDDNGEVTGSGAGAGGGGNPEDFDGDSQGGAGSPAFRHGGSR